VHLRLATRGSELARWQTDHVASLLRAAHPDLTTESVIVETTGDRRVDIPIWEMGGKGVFVKEVQAAVLDGRADVAVHSAKDLPALTPDELVIAAVPERADPRDALVGSALADLPPGARVATGSVRRRAQLADVRPDLTFSGLRGNVPTRVAKAAEFDAVVVAAAALDRLGLSDRAAEVLDPMVMVPQVAQGALAVECRADDAATSAAVATIEHRDSRRAVDAERAFLAELGGDCDLPAGAHATIDGAFVEVLGFLATLDGRVVLRHSVRGPDGPILGGELARHLLDHGGAAIL
jgi:hydroxymethylbilane synthase